LDVSSLPNFSVWEFQKLYTDYHAYLAARQVKKFIDVIPTNRKVLDAYTLHTEF